jgi:hypothetical protein
VIEPLTPADLDLRGFAYMPLDVVRLRDSEAAVLCSGDEFRAAVLLWCAAWHQVPAASLPNEDRLLANLAGYGRDMKGWKAVRNGALRGFVECSDGRLYHPVIAEKANEAATKQKTQRQRTAAATNARKQSSRSGGGERNDDRDDERNVERNDQHDSDRNVVQGNRKEGNREEKIKRADARYAFEGSVVKLSRKHFDDWTKAYASIDLAAELTARDAYLASPRASDEDRKNWFLSTSQHLANRNMEAKSRVVALKPEQPRGIPGII